MGHRPKNYDTTLNVSPETYCKAVGHHPIKIEGKVECSNCGLSLPSETPVAAPGRHIYVMRDGKMVEVPREEVRMLKRQRVHSHTKFKPAVTMDEFANEFVQDGIDARRRLVTKKHQ